MVMWCGVAWCGRVMFARVCCPGSNIINSCQGMYVRIWFWNFHAKANKRTGTHSGVSVFGMFRTCVRACRQVMGLQFGGIPIVHREREEKGLRVSFFIWFLHFGESSESWSVVKLKTFKSIAPISCREIMNWSNGLLIL